jgi:hypothetical protein
MMNNASGHSDLLDTIGTLRLCNALQSEVISNLEYYQSVAVGGRQSEEEPSGRRFGYSAELSYLNDLREALDRVIASVERYCAATHRGEPSDQD